MKHIYQEVLDLVGITAAKAESLTNIGSGTISRAIKRGSKPTLETLYQMEVAFPQALDLVQKAIADIKSAASKGVKNEVAKQLEAPSSIVQKLQKIADTPKTYKPSADLVEGVSESMVNYTGKGVPVYDTAFAMGLGRTSFRDISDAPIAFLSIPEAAGCDAFTTAAHGESMMSYIYPGDWIGFKRILKFKEFIEYGEPYGIITEEFELIKYIRKGRDKNHFLLVSENAEFEDVEVAVSAIRGLFHVKKILPFSPLRNNVRQRRFSENA